MKRKILSLIGPMVLIAGLLEALAAGAASFNTGNTAPRSVFLKLPADIPQPSLALSILQDASGNWVLHIDTKAFQFTDICISASEAVPVGHAHVILDGVKIGSAFSPIMHIGVLPPGQHRVSVVLRGQDHRALIGQNGLINAALVVYVV
ncbi:MAG: hypothetical protein ABJI96_08725 [Paracoccaceae bacterium]